VAQKGRFAKSSWLWTFGGRGARVKGEAIEAVIERGFISSEGNLLEGFSSFTFTGSYFASSFFAPAFFLRLTSSLGLASPVSDPAFSGSARMGGPSSFK
jgi:hypothetical protein